MLKKPVGFWVANLGKTARKKRANTTLMETFPIFIAAYFIGLRSARSLENGMIAKASSAKIQIVHVIYSTLILDQLAKVCRKSNPKDRNPIDDQNSEIVAVEITFFLSFPSTL